MRLKMNSMMLSAGLALALVSAAWGSAETPEEMQIQAERIVSQYKAVTTSPPGKVPSRLHVDGPIMGNGDLGAVISGKPESQRFWISKNNFWRMRDGHRQGGPRLFGGLDINIPALVGASYRIEQDIYPAITTSRFGKDDTTVTMRSYVSATADFLFVELGVTGVAVEVSTRVWAAPGRGSQETTGSVAAISWATKAFSSNIKIPSSAACALKVMGAKGAAFTLKPGEPIRLVVPMRSSFDDDDPLATVLSMAREISEEQVKTLEADHRAWWADFWSRSLVEIGDPLLEKTYYMSNYMMGSGTRDKDFPAGLFSLWVTHDDPCWAGDYHLNFDFQSQYYALYKNNHIEQADTFDQPILDFMERGRWYAKNIFKIRGLYYPVGIGPKGIEPSLQAGRRGGPIEKGGVFLGQKCNAPYCLINMAMRWYHTYDLAYAKKVYPFVLGVTDFWEDYLRFEPFTPGQHKPIAEGYDPPDTTTLPPIAEIDGVPVTEIPVSELPPGRYVSYNDSIQEHCSPDVNALLSLGLAYNTFNLVIDMSKEMGVDADRYEKWEHIQANLSTLPTFEKDGKTVFRYSERGSEWIQGNSVGLQHIYPSGMVGLDDDPALLEIARNTIDAAGRKWFKDNGENSHYPAAARVGYDPEKLFEKLHTLWATTRKWHNGFPESMEQCSTCPNTINEMICMSHRQVLRLFPVWPKARDARFWNLRAEGAFLVSSQLKGGEVQFVKIHSEKGRDCTIVNPWPGKKILVFRDGKMVDTLKGERVVMKTVAGETVVLGPKGEGYRLR
jgi:hypothetical protein